jgi:ribosomal protein S18
VVGNNPTVVEPVRVLNKALGLSFDLTPSDMKKMGFFKSKDNVSNIGEWHKVFNQENDFWYFKSIFFTPSSNLVRSFDVDRFYKNSEHSIEKGECLEDMKLIINNVKNKYSSLNDTTSYRLLSDVMQGGHHFREMCEGVKKVSGIESKGLGRCIHISCSPQTNAQDKYAGYLLGVEYKDTDVIKAYYSERGKYLRDEKDELMKSNNIDPNQF